MPITSFYIYTLRLHSVEDCSRYTRPATRRPLGVRVSL